MKKQHQNGSAILTVLGIISVVSIVCAMLGFMATQQMHSARITREMLKARLIAESGLNKAYDAVKADFSKVANYADQSDFGGGSFKVKSVQVAGNANRAQLISEGVCGISRTVVAADLENRPKTTSDDDPSDDYFDLLFDLLIGSSLDLKGDFKVDVNTIHANGNIVLTGSSQTDAMTVSSAGTITWKKPNGTVTTLSKQSPVEVLSQALLAAIQKFKDFAADNGAVYASGSDIPAAPPGGVAYCTGDATGWNGQGTGCFIFEGAVSFQGSSLNVSSVDGYPALIVMSAGDVKFNAGTVINGAVILPNSSLKINGHAVIYGPILVGQTMTGNGTAEVYAGNGQGFTLPPDETIEDNVVITAWH